MSAIDLIRQGVLAGDWQMVVEGFERLTGESLTPAQHDGAAQRMNAWGLINEARSLLGESLRVLDSSRPQSVQPAGPLEREASSSPATDDGNRFRGEGLCEDEIAESRKASENFTCKERRPRFVAVAVVCSRCGKSCDVHPIHAPRKLDAADESTSFVCDRCLPRGSR